MVILVDAKNLCYRFNWSFQALKTQEGFSTAVLFGFWKEIFRLHKMLPEASFVFCWDGLGPSWRHKLKMGYKATRNTTPSAIEAKNRVIESEEILRPLFRDLGFWTPRIAGVEGDDLMGILAKALSKSTEVRIYSSDKDMLQLVDTKISAWQGWDVKPLDAVGVEKVFGVPPRLVSEIRAMAGDSSDNLKGLPGIGPKKALLLLAQGVRPSQKNKPSFLMLEKGVWDRIHTEYQMATIITDPQSPRWTEEQKEKLTELVQLICQSQGRRRPREEKEIEKVWLDFLVQYELSEIFKERNLLWKIS
jgi:5'-3' exonuclease